MALQLSTGLRNQLLDTGSFRSIFNLSFIDVYAGSVPANADAAISNTKLVTYTNNATATGLTFAAAAAAGVITKTLAETWSGTSVAAGTATFWRLRTSSDTNALSTTFARMQGLIATAGGEINLPSAALLNATLYTLDTFSFTLPTL
jgi:hypothetical protein